MSGRPDRDRMAAVDAARIRVVQPRRDKRSNSGRRRYTRQVGDHYLLLGACIGSSPCARAGAQDGVCSSCRGAVLTPEEKRDAVPPG